MPLPWVRLDTNFWSNPKILALTTDAAGYRAAFVWVAALAYSGGHGTDGFISREALPLIRGRLADADRLVRHNLWWTSPGGWMINDWKDFQESNQEAEKRRQKAQIAAAARWEKARQNPKTSLKIAK